MLTHSPQSVYVYIPYIYVHYQQGSQTECQRAILAARRLMLRASFAIMVILFSQASPNQVGWIGARTN